MRSQKTWLPAVHRSQVLRPLTSAAVSALPPSIGANTSTEIWGKSAGVLPAALASSSGYWGARLQATMTPTRQTDASTASGPLPTAREVLIEEPLIRGGHP